MCVLLFIIDNPYEIRLQISTNILILFAFFQQEMKDSDASRSGIYPVYSLQESIPYASMPSQNAEADSAQAESTNALPTYADPALVAYPYSGLSGIIPYAGANVAGAYNPGAFAVQSGYEGYIVPGPPELAQERAVVTSTELPIVGTITNSLTSLTNTLPVSIRSFATQAITLIGAFLGLGVLGGGLTTAICS